MGSAGQTGAGALIDALAAHGVRMLFGIPGVHTLLPYNLLHQHPDLRPVVTRHEGAAGFAADGYARATGEPGVCLVVPGPGATNLATALLVARSDRVPVVAITATVPAALQGRAAIHELDLTAFCQPLVKATVEVTAGVEIVQAVARALRLAREEPRGPVQLAIPYDLFGQPVAPAPAPTAPQQPVARLPEQQQLALGLTRLQDARAPLIYAGFGVVQAGAGATLVALAEALGAPVITSNKARGVIPEDHPLAAGIPSMAGAVALARDADLCLAVGTRFNEYTTLTWQLPLPEELLRVDHDPAVLQQNYPATVTLEGDVGLTLEWLLERLPGDGTSRSGGLGGAVAALHERRSREFAAFREEQAEATAPFHPRLVAHLLRQALPANAILLSDGSATESWLYEPHFAITQPRSTFVPEIQQTMGYAVGAALGARLADHGRPVVAVVGDGSLLMTLGELATLSAERVPVAVIVFNDGTYNALHVRQKMIHDGRIVGTLLGDLDFTMIARGVGLRAERTISVTDLQQLFAAIPTLREPLLIDVPITPQPLSERYTAVIEASQATPT